MLVLHNETAKCEEKIKVPPNVRKKKELPNVTKVQSHFMLVLHHNMMMIPSNVMFW